MMTGRLGQQANRFVRGQGYIPQKVLARNHLANTRRRNSGCHNRKVPQPRGEQVNPIIERVKRAVTLSPGVYQEIGNDPQGTTQAIIVTGAAALIGGLGTLFGGRFFSWILTPIYAVVGLAIGSGILFLLSRAFQGQGTYIQLFRGLGFATAPQALGLIPILGGIVGGIWSLILAIRAVKETQQVTDGAAMAIVLIPAAIIGVLVFLLLVVLSIALFGAAAAAGS
jgi:hypothetical protein